MDNTEKRLGLCEREERTSRLLLRAPRPRRWTTRCPLALNGSLKSSSLLAVPTAHAQSSQVTEGFPNIGTSKMFVEVTFRGCHGGGRAGRLIGSSYRNRPRFKYQKPRCVPLLGLPKRHRRTGSHDRNSPSRSGAGWRSSFLYACLSLCPNSRLL